MAAPTARLDPSLRYAAEVAAELGVDPAQGLSADEAARRLAEHGPNELRGTPPVPLWRKILAQFQDPLIYLLGFAIAVSVAAWVVEGAEGLPVDALVIAAIVVANAVIGFLQLAQVENAVAALASLTAAASTVLRQGEPVELPSADLVIGDVLVLGEGDTVGADARLVIATGLLVQEAALTGESLPVEKQVEPLAEAVGVADRTCMVFNGSAVASGSGRAVVTATGMATEMGAIAELLDRTQSEPSPLQRELAVVTRALGIAVVAIAAVVMGALAVANGVHSASDLVVILLLGVSLAVAAVPEGLPAVLSLVLAIGVRSMARKHAVVKALHAVETLGSASVVCTDKTGTLTRNEMTLRTLVTPSGQVTLSGSGYRPEGGVPDGGVRAVGDETPDALVLAEAKRVLVGGSLANNARFALSGETWEIHGDPTEAAFLVAAHKLAGVRERVESYTREAELPFSSERKMMSALAHEPDIDRHRLFSKGAPDVLLPRCGFAQVGDEVVPMDDDLRSTLLAEVDRLSSEAYRTLGVAYREVDAERARSGDTLDEADERGLVFLGLVGLLDSPREEVQPAVAEALRAGVRVIMITGDHPATAARIAADLGIVAPGATALTGADLDDLTDDELVEAVRDVSVYARVNPEHKLRIVDALQAEGDVVAMTGDGVNDAPALKSADIGVAMGIAGTEVAKQASTMILGDDNFATIIAAVRQGRIIFDNIEKFLRYLLSSNLGEVATVFFGVLLAGPLGLADAVGAGGVVVPLLATQILWINLVTDSGPALALGVDPEIDDVMARPPRSPSAHLLGRAMWGRIVLVGTVMAAATLLAIDRFLPGGLLSGHDSLETARTAGFTTLVIAQLFNALSSRSPTRTAFAGLTSNLWLVGALLLAAALQVLVVEWHPLQHAFGTTSLDATHWAWSVGLAATVLVAVEIEKLGRRARRRTRGA